MCWVLFIVPAARSTRANFVRRIYGAGSAFLERPRWRPGGLNLTLAYDNMKEGVMLKILHKLLLSRVTHFDEVCLGHFYCYVFFVLKVTDA